MNLNSSGYTSMTLVTGNTSNAQASLDKLTEDLGILDSNTTVAISEQGAALDKLTEDLDILGSNTTAAISEQGGRLVAVESTVISLESRLLDVETEVNNLNSLDLDARVLALKNRLDYLTEEPE